MGDESSIPSHFICAISQKIMKEPHFAADGFTYEGDYIRQWLEHNNTSPMTNLPLPHRELIPNLRLRYAIQEWLQQHAAAEQGEESSIHFICAISQKIMKEPHFAADGFTYEGDYLAMA